ncbi:isoleucine--tRNA ligase [Malonomonas rubra]|uniref:isoleucine--tRNA ligase n=1 Tax=Malonomonas rubra TaxID=57040 RepID=UPI0026F0A848|nr:isoleucine--tRNA ligase [Malonomonas rubra]
MDYKETLNLPQTDFPMRANLPNREPQILKHWKEIDLNTKLENANKKTGKSFILHDGPPYANGHLHMGHALNKTLKDIIIKSKRMQGFYAPYVPGWDCHGLPIELMVDKKLGKKKREMSKADVRRECREYAREWVQIQSEEFQRLGIFGNWKDPYLTMSAHYEAQTARELAKLAERGSLFKGKKPIHWCSSCVTALAEAEVEYADHSSPSIFVKFPYADELPEALKQFEGKQLNFVIWTTTPWTIPANLGVCLNPELPYAVIEVNDELLVLAEGLAESVMKTLGFEEFSIAATFEAAAFENRNCKHPLYERNSLIILGDHVTLDAGTGCVHTAPGHGQDDYVVGLKYGLEIYNPVDDFGRYRDDLELFGGMKLKDANPAVCEKLAEVGALLQQSEISHSYPHCWRCKKPIIFRATEQWFVGMEQNDLRKKALVEIDKVEWIPAWGRDRIYNMVEGRPDWCISRQRSWGVPITVAYCEKCGEDLCDGVVMHYIADKFEATGSDVWFEKDASELLPPGTKCPKCGHDQFTKETDILDVWFDSGVSHAAVCEHRDYLHSPVDLYLEGSDQHRGWFHSSLLESVGSRDRAPYKSVLTHGFVLDKDGRPMSKSLGNIIKPEEIIQKFGAEILRMWVAATDYRDDIRIGNETLQRLSDAYRRIRNTARYLLGNLAGFDPAMDMVADSELLELDRWALSKLSGLVKKVEKAYEKYEFHVIYHAVHNFCSIELSAFYLDILKDRLYTSPKSSVEYRSARTSMYLLLDTITRLIAPVLTFTADEIWQEMPGEREESVHLATFPQLMDQRFDAELEQRYEQLQKIRTEVSKVLEKARAEKKIGQSLEAKLTLQVPESVKGLLEEYREQLASLFIVSQVELVVELSDGTNAEQLAGLKLKVLPADGEKCERCWNFAVSVGENSEHPSICARCVEALSGE